MDDDNGDSDRAAVWPRASPDLLPQAQLLPGQPAVLLLEGPGGRLALRQTAPLLRHLPRALLQAGGQRRDVLLVAEHPEEEQLQPLLGQTVHQRLVLLGL